LATDSMGNWQELAIQMEGPYVRCEYIAASQNFTVNGRFGES